MSIAITKYKVVACDKDGNIVCRGITKNEDAMIAVAAELRKNDYDVRCYDIIPTVGFGGL